MHGLLQHSNAALISNVSVVSASDIYRTEPSLSKGALSALHVPDEAIVDSNLLGVCFAHHARRLGSKVCAKLEVH